MSKHLSVSRRLPAMAAAIAAAALLAAVPALAFEEKVSLDARTLSVANLVGAIEVGPSTTGNFEVTVNVEGKDATPELVQVEVTKGDSARVEVAFPVGKHKTYLYPKMRAGSSSSFTMGDEDAGWFSNWFGGGQIKVAGSGKGVEIWADVKIGVPKGGHLIVHHGAGEANASGVDGEVELSVSSGAVTVAGITGDVLIDTGSGSVEARDMKGDLNIDTGSGEVILERCKGNEIEVDTGSGSVEAKSVSASRFTIDTGSGGVEAEEIEADEAEIDTGSGGVELALARMGSGSFKVDTGSGGIRLELPSDASAKVRADTGSGGVQVDFAGAEFSQRDRDEVAFTLGSGATHIDLSTGSGSIRIRPRS